MTTPSNSTYIPVTTLSNLRANFVPPSLSDLFYLQQGSEHDRDSAGTLEQILESQVIQSFLNGRDNWRTFTAPETGNITLGDYQRNVIIVPSAKDQSVTLDHWPTNGLIIYAPDWDISSESTAVTIYANHKTILVNKGGIGIFYCFGSRVIGQSLIGNSAHSLAELKELFVDNLIVESGLTLPASSILSTHIANGAVTTDKIDTGAVTSDKIGPTAVTSLKIDSNAITAIHIEDNAVGTSKIPDKAITSLKLADQLAFVKTPKFPRKNYRTIVGMEGVEYYAESNYDGAIFSAQQGITIVFSMPFSTADNQFQIGDTYRIYNESPSHINVKDSTTGDTVTNILAWTFKDFYYGGNAWDLA